MDRLRLSVRETIQTDKQQDSLCGQKRESIQVKPGTQEQQPGSHGQDEHQAVRASLLVCWRPSGPGSSHQYRAGLLETGQLRETVLTALPAKQLMEPLQEAASKLPVTQSRVLNCHKTCTPKAISCQQSGGKYPPIKVTKG